jgi:hypothetical protein
MARAKLRTAGAPIACGLPSVLDKSRQIVRLSDKQEELDQTILALRHQSPANA